jgi:hypothetical protein
VHEAVCGPGLWCMKEGDSESAMCVPRKFCFLMTKLQTIGLMIHTVGRCNWACDYCCYSTYNCVTWYNKSLLALKYLFGNKV